MRCIKNCEDSRKYQSFSQFAVILAPFTLFFDAAVLFRGRINLSVPAVIILLSVLNGGLLLATVFACLYFRSYRKAMNTLHPTGALSWKANFSSYIPIAGVAAAFCALASLQFNLIPRFDGSLYYGALITATEKFTFTLESLVSSFTFFTHPMQGTALLVGIGEMLFPRQVVGVYGVTLFITVAAIFCLYGIMGKIFPDQPAWLKAAGTAVFAFSPYLLGLFSHFSPDYFTTMFLVILIYTFSKELDYLAAFLSLLLVFSKETGIIFAAMFLIPAILIRASSMDGTHYFSKLLHFLFPKRFFLYCAAPLLFIYNVFFAQGLNFGENVTSKSPLRWDNNGTFCFGFNPGYISARLAQIFMVNFAWIITILFVSAAFVFLFRKRKNINCVILHISADLSIVSGIILSSFAYLIFSCLFITVMCPRYNVCFALPASIISVWVLSYMCKSRTCIKIIMGCLLLLLLIQNYVNLDPSLSLGNEKIDMGYEYIYSPTGEYAFMQLDFIGEMYVYNHTYTYSDDLDNQLMKIIEPDANDQFVTIDYDWYELFLVGNPEQTGHSIYWDPVNLKRTYDYKGTGVFVPQLYALSSDAVLSGRDLNLADDFYLILTAHRDVGPLCTAIKARGYTDIGSFTVKNYLGYLTVYHFQQD